MYAEASRDLVGHLFDPQAVDDALGQTQED
jgi:hypothetical protein